MDKESWKAKCLRLGGEEKARKLLVNKLRAFANQIESGMYPMVQSADFDDQYEGVCKGEDDLTETISVTLSYPWGS